MALLPPLLSSSSLRRLLSVCSSIKHLKQIHAHLIATANAHLLSLLIPAAAAAPASLRYATSLFLTYPTASLPAYNAIIRAHAPHARPLLSPLAAFRCLLARRVAPDHLTFPFLLKHCGARRSARCAQMVHAYVALTGFPADVFVGNVMVCMYADCGLIALARKVFDEMPVRDLVSWNSMLVGFLRCGEVDAAAGLFGSMGERNVVSWNSMIVGLVHDGRPQEALALFYEMLVSGDRSAMPDNITTASIISACASLGAIEQGEWLHRFARTQGLEFDKVIGTALVDMYGKCGLPRRAKEVFEEIPEKDVTAWTAVISAFATNGLGEEAFAAFDEMERAGVRPNYVTFGALLSACVHSGLLDRGRHCFNSMRTAYGIEANANHYACMVDLLGRAGRFEEALQLIASMPMEPDAHVWGALLGRCQMHRNVELGEKVCKHLIASDPHNHAFYVSLLDIYAKGGRFEDAKKVRTFMNERGIKKTSPGCSSIEVEGRVYQFSVKGALEIPLEIIAEVVDGIDLELRYDDSELLANESICKDL